MSISITGAETHSETGAQTARFARFAIDPAERPSVIDTLPVAELTRASLMAIYGRQNLARDGSKGASPVLSGHQLTDARRTDDHQHAFYLATDEDHDGRLDHITIVAEEGFSARDLRAMDSLRELRTHDGSSRALRVLLIGAGTIGDPTVSALATSMTWVSTTPFIAPRHVKKRGTKRDPEHVWQDIPAFLELVLREELTRFALRRAELRNPPINDARIEPVVDDNGVFRIGSYGLRPTDFQRFRQKAGDDGGRRLTGSFRINFPRPVCGPVVLGYSAHFGMGMFASE